MGCGGLEQTNGEVSETAVARRSSTKPLETLTELRLREAPTPAVNGHQETLVLARWWRGRGLGSYTP